MCRCEFFLLYVSGELYVLYILVPNMSKSRLSMLDNSNNFGFNRYIRV